MRSKLKLFINSNYLKGLLEINFNQCMIFIIAIISFKDFDFKKMIIYEHKYDLGHKRLLLSLRWPYNIINKRSNGPFLSLFYF